MKKRLISTLTAALLLSTSIADASEFYGGLLTFNGVDSNIFKQQGNNFYSWEIGPRDTIVSEEFDIPSWTPTGDAVIDNSTSLDGENSLKLTKSTEYDKNYSGMSQTFRVIKDKTYKINFYVKATNSRGNMIVVNDKKIFLPTGTYNWQKVGVTVYSMSSLMTVDFRSYNKTDALWIDCITVTETDENYNVINNGNFEQEFVDGEFLVNEGTVNFVKSVFDDDAEKGMKAMLLLSPHYVPDWFFTNYPDAYGYQKGFLEGDILNEDYRNFIKTHFEAMASAVSGFSSLHSLCLSNEPIYNTALYTNGAQTFRDDFLAYMKNKYGEGTWGYIPSQLKTNWDISSTFKSWDELYKEDYFMDFGENIYSNGKYWDWMEFNNETFGNFHKFLADAIHGVDETIPVHVKLWAPAFSKNKLSYGTDIEDISNYMDMGGFDGGMSYDSNREGYLGIRMMEDLVYSISGKESVNSENHIVPDGCTDYSEKHALIAGADLWQGIIHGRTSSAAWVWKEETSDPMYANSITYRPDVIRALSATINDANDLHDELSLLKDVDKKFYILYSKASLLYNEDSYMSACYNAYEALWSLGQRASFITEKQIAEGKLQNNSILVIPSTTNIEQEAVTNLNAFTGKTIVIGTKPSKNEYNTNITVSLKNATTISDGLDSVRTAFEAELDNIITLKDGNGNYIGMTDIRAVETSDGILVNICNNTWEEISGVSVYKNGVKLTGGVNLVDNSTVADTFNLDSFTPVLIKFSK